MYKHCKRSVSVSVSVSVNYVTEELTCKVQLRRCRDVSAPQTHLQNQESHQDFETITIKQQQAQYGLQVLTLLLLPQLHLLRELWYDQESLPALTLLGFENVSKDVVANIENVFTFDLQQITDDVRRSCEQNI